MECSGWRTGREQEPVLGCVKRIWDPVREPVWETFAVNGSGNISRNLGRCATNGAAGGGVGERSGG